jgi:hypothetical protein
VVLLVLFVFQRGNTPKQSRRSRCTSFRPINLVRSRCLSPQDFRCLHHGLLALSTALRKSPASQVTVDAEWSQDVLCSLHQ